MQIGDFVNRFQDAVTSVFSSDNTEGTSATPKNNISDSLLTPGNIFEGTITKNSNGNVLIKLQNGGSLRAMLDSGVNVKTGESLFFEVKNNQTQSAQIQIKLYQGEGTNNHTIFSALKSAGVGVNQGTISMVQSMMENQMPIDKSSVAAMAHQIMAFENTDPKTIVDMLKIGIPLNETNIAQFENYRSDQYAVLAQMEDMMGEIPKLLAGESLTREQAASIAYDIIETFKSTGESQAASINEQMYSDDMSENAVPSGVPSMPPGTRIDEFGNVIVNTIDAEDTQPVIFEDAQRALAPETVANLITDDEVFAAGLSADDEGAVYQSSADIAQFDGSLSPAEKEQIILQMANAEAPVDALKSNLSYTGYDMTSLEKTLLPLAESYPEIAELFDGENLRGDLNGAHLMNAILTVLDNPENASTEQLRDILGDNTFISVLKDIMQKQWTLLPKEVGEEKKIENLYEKLDRQMERFAEAFNKADTPETKALAKQSSAVRQNISFLNQINQQYSYVQLPLRMMGQNAHSDLYVYTNKKNMGDTDGTLTAFLHLDMDNLGSTDVKVTMKGEDVGTHFFLEDEKSFDFIEKHLDILTERLKGKGYNVNVTAENKEEKVDFVSDFLKQGQSVGKVHRYSFDVTV